MARKRSSSSTKAASTTVETTQEVNTTNGNTTVIKERGNIMALSPEQIQALLGASRTKGSYLLHLAEFVKSGEAGVCANDQWVDMADKKFATIKQGFENAKQNKEAPDGSENVKVIVNEEKVYLINLAAAGVPADEVAA